MKTFYVLLLFILLSCSKNDNVQQEAKPTQQAITPDIISGTWYVKSYNAGPWFGPIENFNPNDIVISFSQNNIVSVNINTALPSTSNFIYNQNTTANYIITQPNNKIMLKNKPYFIVSTVNNSNEVYLDGNQDLDGDLIQLIKI